jgi:hypothetical protein
MKLRVIYSQIKVCTPLSTILPVRWVVSGKRHIKLDNSTTTALYFDITTLQIVRVLYMDD